MVRTINLAVIGGDGIGPEVTHEAIATLRAVTDGVLDIATTDFTLGAGHFLDTGEILSDETLASLARFYALVLGAVGEIRKILASQAGLSSGACC